MQNRIYFICVFNSMIVPNCIDLNDIQKFLGDKQFNEHIKYLYENKEAMSCLYLEMSLHDLFKWSVLYGFLGFSAYLYISKRTPCTSNDLTYMGTISSDKKTELSSTTQILVTSGSSNNTNVNLEHLDKSSIKRKEVQQFLYSMRKYSKYYYYRRCKCYAWRFDPKYMEIVLK